MAADAGQAGIVADVKLRTIAEVPRLQTALQLLGVVAHGAELDAGEFAPADGFAVVDEKDRPAVVDQNEQGDGQIKGERDGQGDEGKENVEDAFGAGESRRGGDGAEGIGGGGVGIVRPAQACIGIGSAGIIGVEQTQKCQAAHVDARLLCRGKVAQERFGDAR